MSIILAIKLINFSPVFSALDIPQTYLERFKKKKGQVTSSHQKLI